MSVFSDLLAGGAAGLFQGIGSFAKDLREAITGKSILDPNQQAEILMKMSAIEAAAVQFRGEYDKSQMEGQVAINKLEAANARLFVSGWRPAVGWVCVLGLGYTFLLKPLLPWIIAVGGLIVGKASIVPALPPVDIGELIILLGGMLGLGAMRSVDKFNSLPKTTTGG